MRGKRTGPDRDRHDNRLVVHRRVTGNGAQVRAADDGWTASHTCTDRPAVKRSSDGERLVAGMAAAGLAAVVAVADSVGAGRRERRTTLPHPSHLCKKTPWNIIIIIIIISYRYTRSITGHIG